MHSNYVSSRRVPRTASLLLTSVGLIVLVAFLYLVMATSTEHELPPASPPLHKGLLLAKRDEGQEESEMRKVAVAILVTTSLRTPGDIDKSLNGAAVMRWSVLDAYAPRGIEKSREQRKVGLPPFRADVDDSAGGVGEVDEEVDVFRFKVRNSGNPTAADTTVEMRFVALVTPCVHARWHAVLRRIGFEVWLSPSPLNASEVRNKQIATEIVTDGAMGINELVKLEGLRMSQFHSVVMVDCDVLFHKTFDELFFITPSLAWTHGGWESEKINGGFLVFNPRHAHAMDHMKNIVDTVREGDFRPGSGWRGKGIGWTYGGRTIQGVLPHYYFLEATAMVADDPQPHVEIERCRYNNMAQLEKCKAKPYDQVTSNHFTGDCLKPWWCDPRGHPLCVQFRVKWFHLYRSLLLSEDFRDVAGKSGALAAYAQQEATSACPNGGFVSLAEVLASQS